MDLWQKLSWWIPDRKIWLGGTSAIAAWLVLHVAQANGIDPQPLVNDAWSIIFPGQVVPEAQPLLAGLISFLVAYLVPPSVRDKVKRVDDQIALKAGYVPINSAS